MPTEFTVRIDGRKTAATAGMTVAGATAAAGVAACRTSVSGEARGPLCGMGICFECRVTINGQPNLRSCILACENGMEVRTDG